MLRYNQPWPMIFYISVKQPQLRIDFFFFKPMQISKNLPVIMEHARLFTGSVKQTQKFRIPGTIELIGVAEAADVTRFHSGEIPVQLCIKIFPVSFPEG